MIAVQVLAVVLLLASIPVFATYVVKRSNLIFDYNNNGHIVEVVRGTEYHKMIFKVKVTKKMTDEKLLNSFGGIESRDLVWKRESIIEAERDLAVGYMMSFLLTLISTILFVEVLRTRREE